MMINSVMNTGIQGMQSSYNIIDQAAGKIAKAGLDRDNLFDGNSRIERVSGNLPGDSLVGANFTADVSPYIVNNQQQSIATDNMQENIVEPIIEMKVQQHVFDASAKIVKTADEMLGTIMDVKA